MGEWSYVYTHSSSQYCIQVRDHLHASGGSNMYRATGTHWVGSCVCHRAWQNALEERKIRPVTGFYHSFFWSSSLWPSHSTD